MCTELEPIENGAISYDPVNQGPEYNLGTVATYSCEDGYMLIGSRTRNCEGSGVILGNFTGISPFCERVAIKIMFFEPEYTAFEDNISVIVTVITDRPVETPLTFYIIGGNVIIIIAAFHQNSAL